MTHWNPQEVQIQINWERYVGLIQFVILIYDWILTWDQEVELFWKHDCKNLPAILFFVNRYLNPLGNIPIFILYFWPEPVIPDNGEQCL
ncbi:hypothetical protein GYMLUDRAFT_488224 [Collybiopsis luxurians FD-317 M1]|uniref:DUF6533 domain-containing protein n=1 Tax=Collybiopsis luxurians FD-317 M1 TaxID=944289 RepID=A0A0D0CIY5_9AGAR|nr:hypothetical protein GYMLUDRAFT_488224 [Collybiopsis luxurians FD-317 M1]